MSPSNESFGPFEATHWPLVKQAVHLNPVFRQAALNDLMLRYRPALRAHLVFKRKLDRHTAEDVLQGFISDKILERNILQVADESRGQFRLLLLKSLDNYLRDEWRRAARRPEPTEEFENSAGPVTPADHADVFDIAWARQVLTQVLAEMRSECESAGRMQVWEIFLSRIWLATIHDQKVESYESLVSRLALESPAQASNLLITAKRQFRRTLETVIAEYAVTPSAVDREVAELQRILATGREILIGLPFDLMTETPPPSEISAAIPSPDSNRLIEASLPWPDDLRRLSADEDMTWTEHDLAGLLKHQLDLPLAGLASIVSSAESRTVLGETDSGQPTLRDLLQSNAPSVDTLRRVKELSKVIAQSSNCLLPKEVATVIYYAAIAAAILRTGESISSSSTKALSEGLLRVLTIGWCPANLRRMFAEALLEIRKEDAV